MMITAQMVKELRDATGVGMMDCKRRLPRPTATWKPRSTGCAPAVSPRPPRRPGALAAEGLVGIAIEGTKASIVEVNSETDFVARNEQFQSIVGNVAKLAIAAGGDVTVLSEMPYPGTRPLGCGRADRRDRQDRREHEPAPRGRRRGQGRRHRLLCPQHGEARPRQARRPRRPRVDRRQGRSSPLSASRSPCTSPTPTRCRSGRTTSTRTCSRARRRSSPSRRRKAASRLRSLRKWSKAASASSTRK